MVAAVCPPVRNVESTHWGVLGQLHSFFFNEPATTEIYTLSLHDTLPIFLPQNRRVRSNNFCNNDRWWGGRSGIGSPTCRSRTNKAACGGRTWIVHTVGAPVQGNYEVVFWVGQR